MQNNLRLLSAAEQPKYGAFNIAGSAWQAVEWAAGRKSSFAI
jgi:hypothetical protein